MSQDHTREDNRLPVPSKKARGMDLETRTWMGQILDKRQRNRVFDDRAAARFLKHYAAFGRKGDAAHAAGVSYSCVNGWIQDDENFGSLVAEAHQVYLNRLEEVAWERAVEGVEEVKGVTKDGVPIYNTKYSDKLLEILLRKADPTGYGNKETVINNNVNTGVLVAPEAAIEGQSLPIEEVEVSDES